jgi:hypothetical protein
MFRPGQEPPANFIRQGHEWPRGALVAGAPVEVLRTRRLAQNLAAVLEARSLSIRQAAALCGIAHPTLVRLLSGASYPDVATLARLEDGLEVALWGEE